MRSQNGRPSSGRGAKLWRAARITPTLAGTVASAERRSLPAGHQNSSASQWITQLAPACAAARAILVTHRACE